MTAEEILREIQTKPAVPIWPHAGWAYDLCRTAAFKAANKGFIETVQVGKQAKRALTAPMRKRLQIEAA